MRRNMAARQLLTELTCDRNHITWLQYDGLHNSGCKVTYPAPMPVAAGIGASFRHD